MSDKIIMKKITNYEKSFNLNSGTTYSAHDIDKGDGAFEEYDKTRWFIGEKWAGYLNK